MLLQLWYDSEYTEAKVMRAWRTIVLRCLSMTALVVVWFRAVRVIAG
jgi:hypothetical protein